MVFVVDTNNPNDMAFQSVAMQGYDGLDRTIIALLSGAMNVLEGYHKFVLGPAKRIDASFMGLSRGLHNTRREYKLQREARILGTKRTTAETKSMLAYRNLTQEEQEVYNENRQRAMGFNVQVSSQGKVQRYRGGIE